MSSAYSNFDYEIDLDNHTLKVQVELWAHHNGHSHPAYSQSSVKAGILDMRGNDLTDKIKTKYPKVYERICEQDSGWEYE